MFRFGGDSPGSDFVLLDVAAAKTVAMAMAFVRIAVSPIAPRSSTSTVGRHLSAENENDAKFASSPTPFNLLTKLTYEDFCVFRNKPQRRVHGSPVSPARSHKRNIRNARCRLLNSLKRSSLGIRCDKKESVAHTHTSTAWPMLVWSCVYPNHIPCLALRAKTSSTFST